MKTKLLALAAVTALGVVAIKEGGWFTPDENGVDTAGCANVLSRDRCAPCGATTYNTNQVEVEPVPVVS